MWVSFWYTEWLYLGEYDRDGNPKIIEGQQFIKKIPTQVYLVLLQGGENSIGNFIKSNCSSNYYGNPTMKIATIEKRGNEIKNHFYETYRINPSNNKIIEIKRDGSKNWEQHSVHETEIEELRLYDEYFMTILYKNGQEKFYN